MNKQIPKIQVEFQEQNFLPTFSYSLKSVVLDSLSYGDYEDGAFKVNKENQEHLVLFNSKNIARGIELKRENKHVYLTVCLPTTEEELEDFFQMIVRIATKRFYSVTIAKKPLLPKQLTQAHENAKKLNLKLLHQMMSAILNEQHPYLLPSVVGNLIVTEKEAETMWAGVDTSNYRNWLHQAQASHLGY